MKEADLLEIKVTIKNTGDCRGAEIVQIYVGQGSASVHRPARELKGFEKVMLEIQTTGKVPVSPQQWSRKPYTRKELNALCQITPDMPPDEIQRRRRATDFPGMPDAVINSLIRGNS